MIWDDQTLTFMHFVDAFIQSDLQCIQVIHFYCQLVCFLGIEPTTFALQTQYSTTEPQEHLRRDDANISVDLRGSQPSDSTQN